MSEQQILQLLRQIDERVKTEITPDVPAQFNQLVAGLKHLPHNVISSVDRQVRSSGSFSSRKLEDIWDDALIMDASEGSLKLITRQIMEQSVSSARKNYLLTMMAVVKKPTAGSVRAVLPLLEHSQVSRQTLLGVSSLISNARKHGEVAQKELSDAVNAIVKYLKQHESSPDKVIAALKALKNLRSIEDALPTIATYAADSKVKNSVRVAAMDALHGHAASKFVQGKVMSVFFNNRESSEVRIAAYKVLVSHADQAVVSRIVESLTQESDKQVGAFVTSHLENLKESSAPRHQVIRRILESEHIPTQRFPSDLRKYSRNVELSHHIQTLGVGAVVDADLVYDRSIAPRSVRFNLSLPLYEREINVVEVGLRQSGFEGQMKKLLSQNGPLAGKNMPQIFSEIADFLQSDSMNDISKQRVMYQRSTNRPQQNGQQSDVEASMYLNLDGNTVAYFDLADLTSEENDMTIVVKSLKQRLHSADWSKFNDRAFAFSFNKQFEVPSKNGYKPISVNGSVVLGFKVDRSGLYPSMAAELSTRTPEKHIIQRINSSPSLRLNVENNKLTVSLPQNQLNILTITNQAFNVDEQGNESPIEMATRELHACSHSLHQLLGLELCASVTGPQKMWKQEAPCFAPWTVQIVLSKSENKMEGWQMSWELPRSSGNQKTWKLAFDTPRSSIKRNVAVELQVLEKPTTLKAKIQLPRREMEGSVAYRYQSDEVWGKLEWTLEKNQKYSVEAGLKEKPAGKKTEWTPSLTVVRPRSQPLVLTGTVAIENSRKNQLTFNLHNNNQNNQKFIKGSLTREGSIWDELRIATELQAELEHMGFKLFGMAEKKREGSAHTDVKVEYRLPNSRKHEAKFVAKIQDFSSGSTIKMNSFVEAQMTQFPEKNIHVSWNVQHKKDELMENELTIMWRDQMNDPQRRIHILQNSKFTGIRKGRVATFDNMVALDVAPLKMKYEIKAFGHLERGELPSHKLTIEVNNKLTNKDVAASWEYRHTSRSPLKMSIDASLMYPGAQLKYSDKIEEISSNTYKGATKVQWADKKMTHDYVFKVRNEGDAKVYQLDADLKSPAMALQHSSMMKMSRRQLQFNTRMNKEQAKLWDIEAHLSKDEKSALRFEVVGVKGQMEVSPFGSQKSTILEVSSDNFQHYSNLALGESFTINSKTIKDKKPLFVLISRMNRENIVAGPHEWEVRFQAPKSKTGEQKIKVHHEIGSGRAKGTVAYFVKNQEKASFEVYASGKSSQSKVEVAAGVDFKTQYKYHTLDGFHLGFEHRFEKSTGDRVQSESTVRAAVGEEKVRMTVAAEKRGNMKNGQVSGKVIIETPTYDYKHQEAEIQGEWNSEKAKFSLKGTNNENKVVRALGEFENRNGVIVGRMEAESEIHKRKTEAFFTAGKKEVALEAKVNDKEVLRAKAKANYDSPRDFYATVEGKVMNSPLYHGLTEARSSGKQVIYNVVAKKNNKTYASGKMTVDTTKGCDASVQMELARRNIRFSLESRAAKDLVKGPHSFEARVEGDKLARRTLRLTHEIQNDKLRQNVVYLAGETEKFNIDSAIFYRSEREGRVTKHNSDMEITMRTPKMTYNMKHGLSLKTDRQSVQFNSDAKVQGKQTWQIEGTLSKADKSSVTFTVKEVSGRFEVSPFAQTKLVKAEIRSKRYNHDSELEMNPKKGSLKVHSKSTGNDKTIFNLDIVRVADQPNRLAIESKWLDAQMEVDSTKEPMTASFAYNGKTVDKTVAKATVSASKDSFTLNAEGKCQYSKKYTASLKSRRSDTHASFDAHVEEDGREKLAASSRYEIKDGFKGELTLKKDGRELASTRTSLSKVISNGPNEWEIVFNGDESVKVHHEKNGNRLTGSLVHTKAGSRRHFVEATTSINMKNKNSFADLSLDMTAEFADKIFNIRSGQLKLNHQHELADNKFSSKTFGKSIINKKEYDASVETVIDPRAKVTIEMIAQSPIKKFEKQSAKLESSWSRQSFDGQVRLQSSAGCLLKLSANSNRENQRSQVVSGKILLETPNKQWTRQEGEFNAQWSESSASFRFSAADAQNRKIKVLGESEVKADSILARGQCESEFPQIKPSFIQVRGDRESANVLVKFNNKEILNAEGKISFVNKEQFNAELKGKARSSATYLVKVGSNKIAESVKYQATVSKDNEKVVVVEAERSMAHGLKHNIEIQLPTLKTQAALKSELSSEAVHGPHHLQVEFASKKYGKRVASISHKVQDDRIKCSLLYSKDSKTVLNVEHSGIYKAEIRAGQKKLSMDAEIECKVNNKSFKVHHMGNLRINRNSIDFESEAKSDDKIVWSTKGSFSRSDKSRCTVQAGQHNAEFEISPFTQNKQIRVEIRSPHYVHHTEGQFDSKTWELRATSKIQRKSNKLIDFEVERRQDGLAKATLESIWGQYQAQYDGRRESKTAFITIKTKNVKPSIDMKVQGSADRNTIELSGEYKKVYSGSIRASRSPVDYQLEVFTKKNDKPLYSVRANASGRNDGGIKASARIVRKEKEIARVTVSLADEIAQGPHEFEIQLPSEESMRVRHEILAGVWKASAIHMEKGVKKGYFELSGKAAGQWKKADISLNFKGETQGKQIMNIAALQLALNHQHSINQYGYDATTQLKGFINRKENLQLRVISSFDMRRKAALSVNLETPLDQYKNQEFEAESTWGQKAMEVKGKLTNSAGKTVEMKGNIASRSARLIVNGNVQSQIKSIPSMKVEGSADLKGFSVKFDKNERRAFELEGELKSAEWRNVDASIRGKRSSGPTYSASIKGTYERPEASYEFITRQDQQELMAARANAQITNSDDWTTGFQLTSKGSEMASFDLKKGQCESGHKSYTASYSGPSMEKRQHLIHEADVEPIFRTLRKIRGF